MYVVPIFERLINSMEGGHMKQIWILLERNGTYCSSVETVEDAVSYANENDIPILGEPVKTNNFIFLYVDSTSPLLDQFFSWNETLPDEQPMRTVWRPFLWISNDSSEDMWGVNTHLKEIEVGHNISVFDLIVEYREVLPA
jgi:hypothetical protein